MKHKIIILAILFTSFLACSSDDDALIEEKGSALIGAWLRSDYNIDTDSQYTINFIAKDNAGFTTLQTESGGGVISTASAFTWHVSNNVLTMEDEENTTATSFEFSASGNLILADFSEHEFIKQ